MNDVLRKAACISGLLILASCGQQGMSNKDAGALTGGIVGGILGAQFGDGEGQVAAAAAGALIGSMIGTNVGESMDQANRTKVAEVLETAKTNQSQTWVDPDTKTEYTVKPTKTTYKSHTVCRNYTMSVVIDGKLQTANGIACKDAQGNWQIQK
jgi:surface antigen